MKTNWQIKKLGEICDVIAGQSPEGKFYNKSENGLPFYQGKKEFTEKFIGAPITWTTKITKKAEKDDILMSVRAPVGPINFATQEICIGRGLAIIRAGKEINKDFLFNFLRLFENEIVGNKGAVFDSISKNQIENIQIPITPLHEQHRIVKILDEVFENIAKAKEDTEKNLQNAKELFESYLQSVFDNKGKNWEEKKIKEIGKTQTGLTPKTANKKYYGNLVPFITPADVDFLEDGSIRYDNKGLSEKGMEVGRKIEKNSILMVCIGATIGKVGFSTQVVSCNQQINTLTPENRHEAKIFYYILRTKSFFNKIIKNSSQATLPIINKGKWEDLMIVFPKSITEQKSIVKKLDALSAETKKLEVIYKQKLADLEELKKSVLKKAFDGELSISPIPNDKTVEIKLSVPSPYFRNQVHAAIIEQVLKDGGETTEVAVAKYDHLLQEVFGLSLGYQFQTQQFGPFDAQIKRLVYSGLGKNKWFSRRYGMIISGDNINALLSRKSNLYLNAQSAMREMAKLGVTKLNTDKLELLSTICHSIKELKSLDYSKIRSFMGKWQTNNNQTKAQKFSEEQTQKCVDFILKNGLDKKLIY